MSLLKSLLGRVRRAVSWLAREIAATIRWGAEPNAVGRSLNQGGNGSQSDVPASIGGAMAAGAGRRIGAESAEGSVTDGPED
jgi:hypothetical protein